MNQPDAFPSQTVFRHQMAATGLVAFPGVLDGETLAALRADGEAIYADRRAIQERNGVAAGMEGAAHHVLGGGNSLDRFIAALPLWDYIGGHFGGKFTLLNFGVTLHPPGQGAYTSKPHRDVRAWTQDYPLSLNMLVMLDDFTIENGGTKFLKGSHHIEEMPAREDFDARAEQIVGRAGDILLFDSLVVHAAAPNRSTAKRRAMTLCFGRPFMKPHMDWPRFLPESEVPGLTPCARQLLGYDARVPASLDEYYQPPERWTFKPDQR
jgi:hypothetical protein